MKRKRLSIIVVAFLIFNAIFIYYATGVSANSYSYLNLTPTFSDVPRKSYAYEEIQSLKDRGIAEALSGDSFMPFSVMTREVAARMLVKAKGLSIDDSSINSIVYKDISADNENLKYIQAATKHGIFSGYLDGTFKPKEPLSSAQMAAVLIKTFGITVTKSKLTITDMNTNHWAHQYVQTLWAYEITLGTPVPGKDSNLFLAFKPRESITRAQMAIFVYRALKMIADDTLFEGINKNDLVAVKFLLQNGADPNGKVSVPTIQKYYTYNRSTSYIQMLYPAVMNKNDEMVQLLIDYGANVNNKIYFTSTALQLAIDNADYKIAELLLKTNKINPGYYLAYAIKKNQTDIAKLLVQYGAAPYQRFHTQTSTSKEGYYNPYEYAVGLNQDELVPYIKSGSWKNGYQSKNVDPTKIQLPEREFQTVEEMNKFLSDNFSYLYTPVGKTMFSYYILERFGGSDYYIITFFDESFFDDVGILGPNKYYDISTREEVRRLLKEHQEKIETVLTQINKNSKLYGGYHHDYMSIPEDPDPPKNRHYFTWRNYDENSTNRYIRWFPLYDNEF